MESIRKRGQTWGFTVSHTVNGKTRFYRKSGYKTKGKAQLAAAEIEDKMKQGKVPYFIIATGIRHSELLDLKLQDFDFAIEKSE